MTTEITRADVERVFGPWLVPPDVRKHASPVHPGTGSDQSVHGGGGATKPRFVLSPKQVVDQWFEHLKSLPTYDPKLVKWYRGEPIEFYERVSEMEVDKVSDEFIGDLDTAIGKLWAEEKIAAYADKYGQASMFAAKKAPWGYEPDFTAQYLDLWGQSIVVYETDWTTRGSQEYRESMSMLKGWVPWHLRDKFQITGGFSENLPTLVGDGLMTTLRHEYGHHIHSQLPQDLRDEWSAMASERIGKANVQAGISPDSIIGHDVNLRQQVFEVDGLSGFMPSVYSMSNEREFFAETFGAVTHPEYDRGAYRSGLQPILDWMEGLAA